MTQMRLTLASPPNVSGFPPSPLSLGSGLTFGMMKRRKMAMARSTDPKDRKGKMKPPASYKADPTAGPGSIDWSSKPWVIIKNLDKILYRILLNECNAKDAFRLVENNTFVFNSQ